MVKKNLKKGKQNECWAKDISGGAGSKLGIKSPLLWGLKRKAALQEDQKKKASLAVLCMGYTKLGTMTLKGSDR